jgi:hypothetical protein
MDNFNIIAHSNASLVAYPQNNAAGFTIILPKPYLLKDYEVGLASVHLTKNPDVLDGEVMSLVLRNEVQQMAKIGLLRERSAGPAEFNSAFPSGKVANGDLEFGVNSTPGPVSIFYFTIKNISVEKTYVLLFPERLVHHYNITLPDNTPLPKTVTLSPLDNKVVLCIKITKFKKPVQRLNAVLPPKRPKVPDIHANITYREKPYTRTVLVRLPTDEYKTSKELIAVTNAALMAGSGLDEPFFTLSLENVVTATLPDLVETIFLANMQTILGFDTGRLDKGSANMEAPRIMDMSRGMRTIYIYSSLVDSVCVGDIFVPLLGLLSLRRKDKTNEVVHEFQNLMYVPVTETNFNRITFALHGDTGNLLSEYLTAKTVLRLHFRKRSSP